MIPSRVRFRNLQDTLPGSWAAALRRLAGLLALPLLPALCGLLLAACGPFETAQGGSGTETLGGGKAVGRVLYADGTPAAGAGIAARPLGYAHDTALAADTAFVPRARASASGDFRLDSLAPGDWLLELRDASGRAAIAEVRVEAGRAAEAGTATLRAPGSLSGALGRIAGTPDDGWVQILGLARAVRAGEAGSWRLDNLPAGRLRVRALPGRAFWIYRDTVTVEVPSGGSARMETLIPAPEFEDYSRWTHVRVLLFSTAAAKVFGDVEDFPLRLRLHAGNFDFARGSRDDVRFSDAAGLALPYAVERWDSAAREAAVWIRLERAAGNREDIRIQVHSGRPGAADRSDPRAVFAGFAGAWTFSDADPAGGGGTGAFRDGSPSEAHGTGATAAGRPAGLPGGGRSFAGIHSVRAPGAAALRTSGELTVSAWIRVGAGGGGRPIAGLEGSYGLRLDSLGRPVFFLTTDSLPDDGRLPMTWELDPGRGWDLRDSLWHLVAGTYDGSTMRLFIDGNERSSMHRLHTPVHPPGAAFLLGAEKETPTGGGFAGGLDDVLVSPRLRTPNWIRLLYETQRPGAEIVVPE